MRYYLVYVWIVLKRPTFFSGSHVLFTRPTSTFFSQNNFKTGPHNTIHTFKNYFRDNYSKPTWGMIRFHFAYLWFKTLHFAHLNFNQLPIRYSPHPQTLGKHIFREKHT